MIKVIIALARCAAIAFRVDAAFAMTDFAFGAVDDCNQRFVVAEWAVAYTVVRSWFMAGVTMNAVAAQPNQQFASDRESTDAAFSSLLLDQLLRFHAVNLSYVRRFRAEQRMKLSRRSIV